MEHIKDFEEYKAKKRKVPRKNQHSRLSRKPKKEQFTAKDYLKKYEEFDVNAVESFEDYPFSDRTIKGLVKAKFLTPTAIQKAAIMPALKGRDILGSAKTGSGKTLAFLIPLLENLYVRKWDAQFGPVAMVLSPTRELASQTFEVLRNIGHKHDFSAGLLIGGKSVAEEAKHIYRTNILVCTPGRLLHHMDQTREFVADNIQIMILDEADKLLEMGFETTINAIIQNLKNPQRQTLLFSATQTKSVKSLARLALKDPAFISTGSDSLHCTPNSLKQRYLVCDLQDKVNVLYSFIKSHQKCKILVFLSSCKAVQFFYAAFCRLRPGIPLMHLHGRMKVQIKRMAIYKEFCRKKSALLFATDVAARGLDFPNVDWVVQLDCPEDVQTYIHRAGRTARLQEKGNGLLVLLPSEVDGMMNEFKRSNVPIDKSEINPKKLTDISAKMQSICAEDKEMKERAEKCCKAYAKSVEKMKNKRVFKLLDLPFQEYSVSLGLAVMPRLRFLERKQGKTKAVNVIDSQNTKSEKAPLDTFDLDVDDDFMSVKQANLKKLDCSASEDSTDEEQANDAELLKKGRSAAAEAKRLLRKKIAVNQKITFDEEGEVQEVWPPVGPLAGDATEEYEGGIDVSRAQEMMRERDVADRAKEREKVKKMHAERRKKNKQLRVDLQREKEEGNHDEDDEEVVVTLGSPDDDSDDASGEDGSGSDSHDDYDESEDEDEPVAKRSKPSTSSTKAFLESEDYKLNLEDEEDLALHLLRNS